MMVAAMMLLSTTEANAQGFLNKLKQKALQAAKGQSEEAEEEARDTKGGVGRCF